ncbi:Phenylalanine ammonia-lyase [Lachnellula arida]|uniref:Phenylalanine ammonia-lyase n=1 Tax=Lachnellula arida TaxID=1316785 RepID=A0A8T9BFU6_9HELO|nr:Phenylalanine ammonia-lyase [Lachnellula arida]
MGNQSLNSLALIAARYTHTANEVLAQLMAAHLIALCQALDLRALQAQLLDSSKLQFFGVLDIEYLERHEIAADAADELKNMLWVQLLGSFDATVSMDAGQRFDAIAKSLRGIFLDNASLWATTESLTAMNDFTTALGKSLQETWCAHRDAYLIYGDAAPLLGHASKVLYNFVRRDLGVPFLSTARILTPTGVEPEKAPTVGAYNSVVYRAFKDGTMAKVATGVLKEVRSSKNDKLTSSQNGRKRKRGEE